MRLQRQAIRKYLLQKVPITFLIHILLLIKYFCPAGKRTFRIPFLMENNIPNICPNIMEIIGFIKWYVPIVTIRLRWFFGFWKMKRHYTFSIVAGDPVSQNSAPFSSIWQKIFQQKKENWNEQKLSPLFDDQQNTYWSLSLSFQKPIKFS